MKIAEIQKLIDFIARSGLEEVHIETEAIKLHVKSGIPMGRAAAYTPLPPLQEKAIAEEHVVEANYITITSPIIGTFYRSPNPDAPPFVKEGDFIAKGDKLCIIESMKIYNEIEAEVSGKIVKILVDNISPIEYDQPLFLVDPT